jgi:hypothetical protein
MLLAECAEVRCEVSNCDECEIPNRCTRCAPGFFYLEPQILNLCVAACPNGTTVNEHRHCVRDAETDSPAVHEKDMVEHNYLSRQRRTLCASGTTRTLLLTYTDVFALNTNVAPSTNYANSMSCSWAFTAPSSYAVALFFTRFNTEAGYDFFRTFTSLTSTTIINSAAGSGAVPVGTIWSMVNFMRVSFRTDGSVVSTGVGTNVYWLCPNLAPLTLTSSNTIFGTNSNAGGNSATYAPSMTCTWTLTPNQLNGFRARVQFDTSFYNTELNRDFLAIFDGPTTASPLLVSTSGSTIPATQTASVASLTVRFTSDSTVNLVGFRATFVYVGEFCPLAHCVACGLAGSHTESGSS